MDIYDPACRNLPQPPFRRGYTTPALKNAELRKTIKTTQVKKQRNNAVDQLFKQNPRANDLACIFTFATTKIRRAKAYRLLVKKYPQSKELQNLFPKIPQLSEKERQQKIEKILKHK